MTSDSKIYQKDKNLFQNDNKFERTILLLVLMVLS